MTVYFTSAFFPLISASSHARAKFQSRMTVKRETFKTSAVCSTERPPNDWPQLVLSHSIAVAPCLKKLCHGRARECRHASIVSGFGFQIQNDRNVRCAGFFEKGIHQEPLAVRRYDVLLLLDIYGSAYHACREQRRRRANFDSLTARGKPNRSGH